MMFHCVFMLIDAKHYTEILRLLLLFRVLFLEIDFGNSVLVLESHH